MAATTNGDALRLPFPDDTFDRIIASEVLEHVSDDQVALDEIFRVLKPGGTLAATVPSWLPEQICWALSEEYHAPFVEGGHVRIYSEPTLRSRMRTAGLAPGAAHHAHALHSPYWWLKCAVGPHQRRPPAREGLPPGPHLGHRPDAADGHASPASPSGCSTPCSARASSSTPASPAGRRSACRRRPRPRLRHRPPRARVDGIAEWQLPSGMIPWFPGGHADPWNHVEAAMALDLGGRRAEADRAYEWLVDLQRDDGSWHQYYVAGDDGSTQVEQDKLDANVCAYVAAGVWHRWLLTDDRGFVEEHVAGRSRRRSTSSSTCRRPAARSCGPATPTAPPGASPSSPARSSICHSLRCAIAHRPAARPRASRLGDLRRPLARVIREVPEAFAPKHRWAMDWYYPVLGGVVLGEAGRARLDERRDTFLMDGRGVRCVSDRPWITVAETCECAMAYLAVGDREMADTLFGWAQQFRHDADGRYWTGTVFPDEARFPGGERSTYTAATVVLCADALAGATPASALFVETQGVLPPLMDL